LRRATAAQAAAVKGKATESPPVWDPGAYKAECKRREESTSMEDPGRLSGHLNSPDDAHPGGNTLKDLDSFHVMLGPGGRCVLATTAYDLFASRDDVFLKPFFGTSTSNPFMASLGTSDEPATPFGRKAWVAVLEPDADSNSCGLQPAQYRAVRAWCYAAFLGTTALHHAWYDSIYEPLLSFGELDAVNKYVTAPLPLLLLYHYATAVGATAVWPAHYYYYYCYCCYYYYYYYSYSYTTPATPPLPHHYNYTVPTHLPRLPPDTALCQCSPSAPSSSTPTGRSSFGRPP